MNLFSQVFLAVLAILFLTTVYSLVAHIVRNLQQGLKLRGSLAARVEQLRLHRMIGKLGIDVGTYVHRVRVADVEKHMATCRDCTTQTACDERANPDTAADYSFCPNQESLRDAIDLAQRRPGAVA